MINEATARNYSLDEMVRINEPWCATEIYRRLQEEPNIVVDVSGYYTQDEYEDAGLDEYDRGIREGYSEGYKDKSDGKKNRDEF